jgi:hypothetical protein
MAAQLLVLQVGVGTGLAGRPREVFDRTDHDQLGQGAGLPDGSDRSGNPDAHWFHVRHDQFGKEPSGLPFQAPQTAYSAHHFVLGPATNEMLNDAR